LPHIFPLKACFLQFVLLGATYLAFNKKLPSHAKKQGKTFIEKAVETDVSQMLE
jgi:hypothetical protein